MAATFPFLHFLQQSNGLVGFSSLGESSDHGVERDKVRQSRFLHFSEELESSVGSIRQPAFGPCVENGGVGDRVWCQIFTAAPSKFLHVG